MINLPPISKYFEVKTEYKTSRDEMLHKAVAHINKLRENTPYCKCVETIARLAKRCNMNPFLAGKKNDGELLNLLNECKTKNNYSKLYWILDNKKTK